MKAIDIISELTDLERKRDEIDTVLSGTSFGEAVGILQGALDIYQKKVDTFLDSEFEPKPSVLFISVTPTTLSLDAETTHQLAVTATFADGTTKDVTKEFQPLMLFSDYDRVRDNSGFLTSVDVSGYTGDESTFEIVKTSTGFDVDDLKNTQGLGVEATANASEYRIIDKVGAPIGITFVTNNSVVTGDNWLIDIYFVGTGTTYTVEEPTMASVDENGLIEALGGGETTITVRNGSQLVELPLVITDSIAPEPPNITEAFAIERGARISFDPSTSLDAVRYNLYVNGLLEQPDILESPVIIELYADDVTSYSITMTAIDTSGNESTLSEAVSVVPSTTPTE